MKARFVFENIEFERGIDPKEALGIGSENYIWNWANEFPFMEGIISDKDSPGDWYEILSLAISEKRNDFVQWILDRKKIDPNKELGYLLKRAVISDNLEALEIMEKTIGFDLDLLDTMVTVTPYEIKKIKQKYKKFKNRN